MAALEARMTGTKYDRRATLAGAFTPHAPINDAEHFALRDKQVHECTRAMVQTGLHIALYGERGVGKTSLAKVLPDLLRQFKLPNVDGVRIACGSESDFRSIWRSVFKQARLDVPEVEAADFGPEDVRFALEKDNRRLLVVIDELDRLDGETAETARSLLADTLKSLSDNAVNATVMLVGVADTLDLLLGDHFSVVRSLVQVHMPRMSAPEAREVLTSGYAKTDLGVDPDASDRIVELSEGLPHFVHLLAQHAGERAITNDDFVVTLNYVNDSLEQAVTRSEEHTSELQSHS